MCLIIVKEQIKSPSRDILKTAATKNPHGLGVYWLDTKKIEYYNSSEWAMLINDRPYIAHFRFATVGKIDPSNVHPFTINRSNGTFLFQNGTIPNIGSEEETDTEAIARALRDVKRLQDRRTILSTYNCRFVEVSTLNPIKGNNGKYHAIYNLEDWHERDGILYSKANCFTNYVAVYGTLKKGFGNNYLLNRAEFIGEGKTTLKYKMWGDAIPYINNGVDNVNGHQITVEVYKVSDNTLRQLDTLENHPKWYERKETLVALDNEPDFNDFTAWVYFNDQKKPKDKEYISEFKQVKRSYYGSGYGLRYNSWNERRNTYQTPKTRLKSKPSWFQKQVEKSINNGQKYCNVCNDVTYTEKYGTNDNYCTDCFSVIK